MTHDLLFVLYVTIILAIILALVVVLVMPFGSQGREGGWYRRAHELVSDFALWAFIVVLCLALAVGAAHAVWRIGMHLASVRAIAWATVGAITAAAWCGWCVGRALGSHVWKRRTRGGYSPRSETVKNVVLLAHGVTALLLGASTIVFGRMAISVLARVYEQQGRALLGAVVSGFALGTVLGYGRARERVLTLWRLAEARRPRRWGD